MCDCVYILTPFNFDFRFESCRQQGVEPIYLFPRVYQADDFNDRMLIVEQIVITEILAWNSERGGASVVSREFCITYMHL